MKKEERRFTEEGFELRSEKIQQDIVKARMQIRKALLSKSAPAQKKKIEKALGAYGTEQSADNIRAEYEGFIKRMLPNFYAETVVDYSVREYAREFGPQKVLDLKDGALKGDKIAVAELKSIATFEELKEYPDRNIQALLWGLDWLDMVRALKFASASMRKKFKDNMSKRYGKDLEAQIKASPATLEQSIEAQRRILRMASALGI